MNAQSPEDERMSKWILLPAINELNKAIGHNVYTFVVNNTGHLDFSDSALYKNISPILHMLAKRDKFGLQVGSIDGFRAIEIVNAYLVNFFDKYLKNKPSELLDGDKKIYPEVETKLII